MISRLRHLSVLSLALGLLLSAVTSAEVKEICKTCRNIVDRFHKGLENTAKKNFGGGNTAWEEKTLSKYESSEIRLVEIIETLCDSSDFDCNHMVEEHEEYIEKWWFKIQKKNPDLFKWFCIETIKVCCPVGTYGPDCLACLGGSERPCHGNGHCNGDGTRSGDGSCSCTDAYTGPFCLECADGYYSTEKNNTYSVCTVCHESCKTCSGPTNRNCQDCKEGWSKDTEEACVDMDECAAEVPPCKDNQYCLNSEGSYSCKACDRSCTACRGEGPDKCRNCSLGYTLEGETCTDVNECNLGEKVCPRENEDCINTPGSYKCTCSEGYEDKEGACVQGIEETEETEAKVEETLAEHQEQSSVHEDL